MQIPYNYGKTIWNKNMVCRVIENAKYIGEDGYPKIVSSENFERATHIKAERNTYRKSVLKGNLQCVPSSKICTTEYEPTDEIRRMNNEINRLLDSKNADKFEIEKRIAEYAQLKYSAIKEVIM